MKYLDLSTKRDIDLFDIKLVPDDIDIVVVRTRVLFLTLDMSEFHNCQYSSKVYSRPDGSKVLLIGEHLLHQFQLYLEGDSCARWTLNRRQWWQKH